MMLDNLTNRDDERELLIAFLTHRRMFMRLVGNDPHSREMLSRDLPEGCPYTFEGLISKDRATEYIARLDAMSGNLSIMKTDWFMSG